MNPRPLTVNVAVVCLILIAAWQTYAQLVPALAEHTGGAFEESLTIALWLLITWGVFKLKSWAWWLALIPLTVMTLGCGAALFYFESFVALAEFENTSGVWEVLAATTVVSAVGLFSLASPSARAAFR